MAMTYTDVHEVRDELDKLARRAQDPTVAMRRSANVLVTAVDDEFETEGRGTWLPSRRAKREKGKTLQDRGILAGATRAEYDRRSAAAVNETPYGRYHVTEEHGGTKSVGDPYARDFMAVDHTDVLDEICDIIADEMTK